MGKTCGVACAKTFLVTYNCLFVVSGGVMFCGGLWLHVDKEVINYFSILHTTPTGYLLDQLAYLMIGIGAFTTFVGFQGCCGACCESVCMLCLYTLLIILVLIGELIIGILIGVFRIKIATHIAASMQQQVKFQYNRTLNTTHDLTLAWDLMHLRLNCCGALGPEDYMYSYWYNVSRAEGDFVPVTCCFLSNDNTKYPMTINEYQCQIDALLFPQKKYKEKLQDKKLYVRTKGCAAELLSWFKRHSKIFIGTTAGVVFLQLFGLILGCCLMTCIRREQSKYPWYIDDEEEE